MQKLDKETTREISRLINKIESGYIMISKGYDNQRWQENINEAMTELQHKYGIGRGA